MKSAAGGQNVGHFDPRNFTWGRERPGTPDRAGLGLQNLGHRYFLSGRKQNFRAFGPKTRGGHLLGGGSLTWI